jgi:EcsC protein family
MKAQNLQAAPEKVFSHRHAQQLIEAVNRLETPNYAARLADYAGQPINSVIKYMPKTVNNSIRDALSAAIFKCLEIAVTSVGEPRHKILNRDWPSLVMSGVSGAFGGFFGPAALPFELIVTTTVMMRAIANIAHQEGEDVEELETMLACLEVFAIGGRSSAPKADIDYYAVRLVMSKLTKELTVLLMERGAVSASSPIVAKLVGEIVTRLGLVVSDMAASSAIPVIGAFGGATVNMIFMDHFQRVAHGHFSIRRLEKIYGIDAVRQRYLHQLAELHAAQQQQSFFHSIRPELREHPITRR